MAEKIVIEIFKQKLPDDFSKALADPDSRLLTGSAEALSASMAAALLGRAAALSAKTVKDNERLDYILRNCEVLRSYMIHLIDEDVKAGSLMRRAQHRAVPAEIEAVRRPSVSICEEIINMMGKLLELADELCNFCVPDARHFVVSAVESAMGTVKAARAFVLNTTQASSDETYRFVSYRENELTMENCQKLYEGIISKLR